MKRQLKRKIFIFSLFILIVLQTSFLVVSDASADINERINYQGKLTDASSVIVDDGDYRMYFRLYTAETGGSAIWTEDRSTAPGDQITITSGLFSVMLGSSTALSGVDFNQTLYLGVEICGLGSGAETCDGEMSPRKMIGAVPAAVEAKKLSGLNSSQFLRSDAENSTSTASTFLRITQSGAGSIADFVGQAGLSILSILSGGNVGVGTSSPYARLSVAGQTVAEYFTATSTTQASTFAYASTTALTVSGTNGLSLGSLTGPLQAINGAVSASSTLSIVYGGTGISTLPSYGQVLLGNTTGGYTLTATSSLGISGLWTQNGSNIYYTTGNVGIGTTSPYAELSVSGQSAADYFSANLATATSTFAGGFNAAGSSGLSVLQNGFVGVGTAAPRSQLSLPTGTTASGGIAFGDDVTIYRSGNNVLNLGGYFKITTTSHGGFTTGPQVGAGNFTYTPNSGLYYRNSDDKTLFSVDDNGNFITGTPTGMFGALEKKIESNSTGVGFFATSPVAKQGATTDLRQALINYGLYTTGGATPLNLNGGALTAGSASIGSLTGPLQAINGAVSASSTLSIVYGGTGISTLPSYGQVLLGNAEGGYTLTATSSLGISGGSSLWSESGLDIYYSAGNVGIGTNAPAYRLDVVNSASSSPALVLRDPTGNNSVELRAGTSTLYNIFMGIDAGPIATTGYQNNALGYQAMYKNTTGYQNNAFGYQALYTNTSGYTNNALGYQSMYKNTSGHFNNALGKESLWNNTVGNYNNALGYQAMYTNAGGNYNNAFGLYALFSNTTGGDYNNAFGYSALHSNQTGDNNIGLGYLSLFSNTTGDNNIGIGFQSGRYAANGSTANQTSSNSIYIGANTRSFADGDTNEVVIGDSAIGVGSNSVVLGNDSITTTILKGNIGVGTTSPYAKLSVVGQAVAEYFTATSTTATSTFPLLAVTGGLSTALTQNSVTFIGAGGMLNEDNSNFTYVPSSGLTVQGGLSISTSDDTYSHFGDTTSIFSLSDTSDRVAIIKDSTETSGSIRALASSIRFNSSSLSSATHWGINSIASRGGTGNLTASTGAGGISGGQFGVSFGDSSLGDTTLATGLSIITERPNATISPAVITELIGLQIESGSFNTTTVTDYSGIRIKDPTKAGGSFTNSYGLRIDDLDVATNNWAIYADGTTKSYFGGNVGIGTTTPYSKLTVWGASTGSAKIFELVNSASTTVFSIAEDGTTSIGAATAGNIVFDTTTSGDIVLVGIGTTTPDADVAIVSDQATSNTYLFTVATTTGDVIDRKFTIDSDGDIAYDGTASTPADYAEAFGVVGQKENYEPGDIIVTSDNHRGKVEKATMPYQAKIAGVYSTKPGILGTLEDPTTYQIGETQDIPVGIMGRVPTKVSIENGPIEVGDYITSSNQPGVGMKATSPGKVVGVALEGYNGSGVGKIMVFLNDTFYMGEEETDLVSRVASLEALISSGSFEGEGSPFQRLFDLLRVKIKDGLAYFADIITERLTVGSREKPSGITIFDEETGEPYCFSVKKGKTITKRGECKILEDIEINDGGSSGGGSVNNDEEENVPPPNEIKDVSDGGSDGDDSDDNTEVDNGEGEGNDGNQDSGNDEGGSDDGGDDGGGSDQSGDSNNSDSDGSSDNGSSDSGDSGDNGGDSGDSNNGGNDSGDNGGSDSDSGGDSGGDGGGSDGGSGGGDSGQGGE